MDQRAESGYMKSIEDAFQNLAEDIIARQVTAIGEVEKNVINDFYALWRLRATNRYLEAQEIQLNGVTGSSFTRDVEETIESKRGIFAKDNKIPSRFLNGLKIQMGIDRYVGPQLSTAKWGIITALEGEFLVPDVPLGIALPIMPTLSLVSPAPNGAITKRNVAEINRAAKGNSREYFFARDLSSCPF